jgi:hypothetical protein
VPNARDAVFDRVTVDHVLKNGTRVSWRLRPEFMAPPPFTFQLQIGESGLAEADDWTDLGDPTDDVVYLLDETGQHDFAVMPTTHYRVKLTTVYDTFYSPPVNCWGRMHRHDWLNARAIIRRELLRQKICAGAYGWLFKRRKRTEPVTNTAVVDFLTKEIINTQGTEGVGTDLIGGYFQPVPFFIDLAPNDRYSRRSEQGQIDEQAPIGRSAAFPELDHGDVWATATGDARYAVHRVTTLAQIRGVPIIVAPALKRLSPSDPIYDLPLPETPPLQTLGREEF